MKYLAAPALLLVACAASTPAPTTIECRSNRWESYHLPDNALSPVILDQSEHYDPDLTSWNEMDTPIELRDTGDWFPIVFQEGGDEDSPWWGLASITVDAYGHMNSCAVTMNYALLRNQPPGAALATGCQELGHCLGLDHHDDVDSCMNSCADEPHLADCLMQRSRPSEHDAETLRDIYKPGHYHEPPPRPDDCDDTQAIVIHEYEVPDE